jgi:hypothetical protein
VSDASFRVPGPVGATRYRGRELREELEGELRRTQGRFEIDLSALDAMTVSFADELVGRVLAARHEGEWPDSLVILVIDSEDIRETVEAVLERRHLIALYRKSGSKRLHPLAAPSWFESTLHLARELKVFRATDLAARLSVTAQAANGRLQQLLAVGAVSRERATRERGGKEFVYRSA